MTSPSELIGTFTRDPLNWTSHHRIDGHWALRWATDRLGQLPEGALVRISIEVLDPHPDKYEICPRCGAQQGTSLRATEHGCIFCQ